MDAGVSILTIVATAVAVAKQLQKIISRLRNAPEEIVDLLFEVQAVRLVLHDIESKRVSAAVWIDLTALQTVTGRTEKVLGQVHDMVAKLVHLDGAEELNFNRVKWYFKRDKGDKYLQELRNLRDTAVALVSCASLSASVHTTLSLQKTAHLLEQSRQTQEQILQSILQGHKMTGLGFETFERGVRLLCAADVQQPQLQRVHTLESIDGSAVVEHDGRRNSPPALISMRGRSESSSSLRGRDDVCCPQGCLCACHRQWSIRTPAALRKVAGRFSLKTSGFALFGGMCTSTDCARHLDPSVSLQYYFPSWLMHRMIHVLASWPGDPKVVLNAPRILSQDEAVFELARSGNIGGLQQRFSARTASPHVVTEHGETLLQYAIAHAQPQTCRFLIEAGSSPEVENKASSTPGQEAWNYILRGAFDERTLEEYRTLFADSGDLEDRGFSIVHEYVLGLRRPDSLAAAIQQARAFIDSKDRSGKTPLHWAALRGDVECLLQLLRLGANPSIHDVGFGNTPLDYAVRHESGECTRILLERGASPHTRTTCKWTPLYGCGAYRRSPFENGHVESAAHLLKWGARVEDRDEDGHDALIKAVRQDMPKLVTLLLDVGNAVVDTVDAHGVSAVAFGIRRQSYKALPIILRRKPDLCTKDFKGNTILHEAASSADTEILSILREARILGPDPNAENYDGFTAISIAQRRQSVEFLSMFSDFLAEIHLRNTLLLREKRKQKKESIAPLDMEKVLAAVEAGYGSGSHEASHTGTSSGSPAGLGDNLTTEMMSSVGSMDSEYHDALER